MAMYENRWPAPGPDTLLRRQTNWTRARKQGEGRDGCGMRDFDRIRDAGFRPDAGCRRGMRVAIALRSTLPVLSYQVVRHHVGDEQCLILDTENHAITIVDSRLVVIFFRLDRLDTHTGRAHALREGHHEFVDAG